MFKSNKSKMERARLGVSRPKLVEEDIARITHKVGESVKEVSMFIILRKIARERSGRISSVI